VAVKQFSCHNAAEFFNFIDFAVNRLLEYFVDDLKIPGKVGSLETAGQIHIYIKIGNENDRSLVTTMYLNEFFHIFNADTGEVYADIGRSCLYIRQFPAE
jgi:hypothetical protein